MLSYIFFYIQKDIKFQVKKKIFKKVAYVFEPVGVYFLIKMFL